MKKFYLLFISLFFIANIFANNLKIENTVLNPATGVINFNVSWRNSWRTVNLERNWDAAWVFVKYKLPFDMSM